MPLPRSCGFAKRLSFASHCLQPARIVAAWSLFASYGRTTTTVTESQPDEYELYDLTLYPTEQHNLAHPSQARRAIRRALRRTMLGLLNEQLAAKRLTPSAGERPGHRPPVSD